MIRPKSEPARGVLRIEPGDTSRHRHARYHPSPDLAPFVEHYWVVEWDLRGVPPVAVATLPHPSVHVIFERDAGGRVAGVARGRFSRELSGIGGVVAAKFKPGGFRPFLDRDVSALTDRTLPVADVFGAASETASQAILAAPGDDDRVRGIETFLRSREPVADPVIDEIASLVYAAAGDRALLTVDDLAARAGRPLRALQRLFAKYVGVSPKWVIQRYRLHEAAERIAADPALDQVELALSLGYADQAHFVRDFKAMVGMPPGAYARRTTWPT